MVKKRGLLDAYQEISKSTDTEMQEMYCEALQEALSQKGFSPAQQERAMKFFHSEGFRSEGDGVMILSVKETLEALINAEPFEVDEA